MSEPTLSADSAQTFFWNAVACATCADHAIGQFRRDGASRALRELEPSHGYVCVMLLTQGIELSVKSWFIQEGLSAEELRRRSFAHDLVALLERAQLKGYPLGGQAEAELLGALNCMYRDEKELQTPKPRTPQQASPLAARELLHETLLTACAVIYPTVDLDRVRAAATPGRWRGLRMEQLGLYIGRSLSQLREQYTAVRSAPPQRG